MAGRYAKEVLDNISKRAPLDDQQGPFEGMQKGPL